MTSLPERPFRSFFNVYSEIFRGRITYPPLTSRLKDLGLELGNDSKQVAIDLRSSCPTPCKAPLLLSIALLDSKHCAVSLLEVSTITQFRTASLLALDQGVIPAVFSLDDQFKTVKYQLRVDLDLALNAKQPICRICKKFILDSDGTVAEAIPLYFHFKLCYVHARDYPKKG